MDTMQERLQVELGRGETLVWTGQPRQGFMLRKQDWFLIPFSLVWGGGALAGVFGVLFGALPVNNHSGGAGGAGFLFPGLFGLVFFVAAIYLIFGRFLVDSLRRSRTRYALTKKRAIILSGKSLKSVQLANGMELTFDQERGGRGTIKFGAQPSIFSFNASSSLSVWGGAPVIPTFESIDNALHVYGEVKRLSGI